MRIILEGKVMRCLAKWPKALLAFAVLTGGVQSAAAASRPAIVAVDGTLCDLTATLVGAAARVTCLLPPGANPHSYQMKPSDRQALSRAALMLHNGFGLTPSIKKISTPAAVVAVGEQALPGYRGNDPHVWHDPQTSLAMLQVVSREVSKVLPEDLRAGLSDRTEQATAVFRDLSRWGSAHFATLSSDRRVIATDHRTYSHLVDRFGLREIAMLDSHTTGGVLRPSSLKAISDDIQSSGAQVIFKPSWQASKTLKRISKRSGVPISSTPLHGEGVAAGENAVSTAVHNICAMVNGQGGQCDQASGRQIANRWTAIR